MLHQFRTVQGDIEVTVAKQGDVWHLGEHQAIVEDDGRLSIHLSNGMKGYATTAKVGDVWWVHFEGHTFCLERIEPGASQSGDGGGLIAPMPGKVLEVFVEPLWIFGSDDVDNFSAKITVYILFFRCCFNDIRYSF